MGKMQRTKGATAERELLARLNEGLGINLSRNLKQTREGGADCDDLEGFSLEIKRQETLCLPDWWRQANEQAGDKIPVLAYRQSRKPWSFVLDLYDLCPDVYLSRSKDIYLTATISMQAFIVFVRQRM